MHIIAPEDLAKVDPLSLQNAVTVAALVALLIRKGLLTDEELVREIRALRAQLAGGTDTGEP